MVPQEGDKKIATFRGSGHFAAVNSKGELCIYFRKPEKTIDRVAQDVRELAQYDPAKHSQLLAEINKKNAEFWKGRQ